MHIAELFLEEAALRVSEYLHDFAACLLPSKRGPRGGEPLPAPGMFRALSAPGQRSVAVHIRNFFRYARYFRTADRGHNKLLQLKERHTLRVLRNALRLSKAEVVFADPLLRRSLLLAALYHDIARFYQYSRYHTFSDARSCDHGEMGRDELRRLGLLDGEEAAVRDLVMAAVCLHNRHTLPPDMPEGLALVTRALRDCDKLDILCIMAANLGKGKRPDPVVVMNLADTSDYTPSVLAAVANGGLASYSDMATVTDMCLLLCGWFHDLNFTVSRRMAVNDGYLRAIVLSLPPDPALAEFTERFLRGLRP